MLFILFEATFLGVVFSCFKGLLGTFFKGAFLDAFTSFLTRVFLITFFKTIPFCLVFVFSCFLLILALKGCFASKFSMLILMKPSPDPPVETNFVFSIEIIDKVSISKCMKKDTKK